MNDKFELPDGSYAISDIQAYFKYIIDKQETVTNNPLTIIYIYIYIYIYINKK